MDRRDAGDCQLGVADVRGDVCLDPDAESAPSRGVVSGSAPLRQCGPEHVEDRIGERLPGGKRSRVELPAHGAEQARLDRGETRTAGEALRRDAGQPVAVDRQRIDREHHDELPEVAGEGEPIGACRVVEREVAGVDRGCPSVLRDDPAAVELEAELDESRICGRDLARGPCHGDR